VVFRALRVPTAHQAQPVPLALSVSKARKGRRAIPATSVLLGLPGLSVQQARKARKAIPAMPAPPDLPDPQARLDQPAQQAPSQDRLVLLAQQALPARLDRPARQALPARLGHRDRRA